MISKDLKLAVAVVNLVFAGIIFLVKCAKNGTGDRVNAAQAFDEAETFLVYADERGAGLLAIDKMANEAEG